MTTDMNNTIKTKFIVLEGGEGVGKSSVGLELKKQLEERGFNVILTGEPNGTIREFFLNSHSAEGLSQTAQAHLMFAARHDHLTTLISPAVKKENTIVICDRFMSSTFVYQKDMALIRKLMDIVVEEFRWIPAFSSEFLINLPGEISFKRVSNRGVLNRFDAMSIEQHKQTNQNFKDVFGNEYTEWTKKENRHVINAIENDTEKTVKEIAEEIIAKL